MRHITIGRGALFALAMLAAGIAAMIGAVGNALADSAFPENDEVSISARALADGRIEFALYHVNLEWDASYQSEYVPGRVLPDTRYFPTAPEEGKWLYSSVELVSFDRPGDFSSYYVRITARRLPDGRTEFGLRRWLTTRWSDVLLPASRFMPADAATGRWLTSTPVDLTGGWGDAPASVPVSGSAVLRNANLDGYTWNGLEASLYYGTHRDELDDSFETWVVARAVTDDNLYDTIRLQAGCYAGDYFVSFWEDSLPYVGSDDWVSVRYRIDDGEIVSDSWVASSGNEDNVHTSRQFEREIAGADKVVVRMSFYSRTLTATFTGLEAMWNTPVQPNLDYCGRY